MLLGDKLLVGSYDYRLVSLSVIIAICASYAALDLAGRVTAARGSTRAVWLTGGATAMGIGIWSMHYIGMLAFTLPIPVLYDWPTVLVSLLAAMAASGTALYVVSRPTMKLWHTVVGSIFMGSGIAAMHYVGMDAMRLAAMCSFNMPLVVSSVALAIVISYVALWLAFRAREDKKGNFLRKIVSAAVMGAAIPVMHYTGMAAATFSPSDMAADMSHAIGISSLGTLGITLGTMLVLVVAVLTSVVDRRYSAKTLELKLQLAEAANRAKSEFLANMSHEIRTPMNGIIGMTELALETKLTAEQREYLSMVKTSADSLLVVINDILDFSKVEAGKFHLDQSTFNLRDSLEETTRTLGVMAGEKGLELLCDIRSGVPKTVVGDPTRLRQIVMNLIGNAIKFTEHGEVVLQVEAKPRQNSAVLLHFAVRDTGIGISPEKCAVIFEAFAQADSSPSRKYGGTGLGLTISSRFVEMMGGKIWVESSVGHGSTFHFTAELGIPQETLVEKEEIKHDVDLAGLPVLIVDDNPTNLRILEKTLLGWAMKPILADSGRAALAALKQANEAGERPQLLLVDAQMPLMDGFSLIERLKQDPDLPTATVMMLTSGGQRGDASRCRELNISGYLTKPVRQWELREAILSVLGTRKPDGGTTHLVTRSTLRETRKHLRLLLAEDNATNREVAVRLLSKRGHTIVVAANGKEAVAAFETQSFDLILMDVQMPEMDGFEATAAIRQKEKSLGRHIPIVAMTAHAMKGDRERCLAAGMDGYLSKPIHTDELIKITEGITGNLQKSQAGTERSSDVFDAATALSRLDGDEGLFCDLATTFCSEGPKLLRSVQVALSRNDCDALGRASHALRGSVSTFAAKRATEAAAVLEDLAGTGDLAGAEEAFETLGAQVELLRQGLENYIEVVRAARERTALSVIMADLDHFKCVNDAHGHSGGDAVLREVSRRILASVRSYDSVGRYGGEEFLIVAPGCGGKEAAQLADRLRKSVGQVAFDVSGCAIAVTMSFGIADVSVTLKAEELLRSADEALYAAKRNGRDRVEVNSECNIASS
jgi:diguanylate cyclase (GGDEF)-like protein